MAWQFIPPEEIVKGFEKGCISHAVDGNDEEMLWTDSEEDGDVRSEF
jgi:hypothetical protein